LAPLVNSRRIERFSSILQKRTKWITVVLDDFYHRHNMSAVIRSAEAFGIQDVHVAEISNPFKPSKGVALGTEQWITLFKYPSVEDCIKSLRQRGYKLFCANPPPLRNDSTSRSCYSVDSLPIETKVAVIFGRELDGLHKEFLEQSDGTFFIPMKGLAESLNVSVCAGITLYELRKRMEIEIDERQWRLSYKEKEELLGRWILNSVRHGPAVFEEIEKRMKTNKKE